MKYQTSLARIVNFERDNNLNDEAIKDLQKKIISHCHEQASKICSTLEIPPSDEQYAQHQFATEILNSIAQNWVEFGDESLRYDYAEYMTDLISDEFYMSLPAIWQKAGHLASFQVTCINAIDNALKVYRTNTMFHDNEISIRDFFSTTIIESAQLILKNSLQKFRDASSEEQQLIYQSAIKSCGFALSDAWRIEAENFRFAYENAQERGRATLRATKGDLNRVKSRCIAHAELITKNLNSIFDSSPSKRINKSPSLN